MNLLMTKLSRHNNLSVLIICHELYPKGKNSILFREQLTSVHLHSIASQQKVKRYVYGFLADNEERRHFDELFNEHVLRVNDNLKGNRRGSIFVRFTPAPYQGTKCANRIGRFLTFNKRDFSVIHQVPLHSSR